MAADDGWPAVNDGYVYRNEIKGKSDGAGWQTVLGFYCARYGDHASAADWQQRLAGQQVWLNGAAATGAEQLSKNDVLEYRRPPWTEPAAPWGPLVVLYEDKHVLVVDKPSGLQVLPGGVFYQRTCLTLLQRYHARARAERWPRALPPAPMHRLGRGTSGVLVCACTPLARQRLVAAFAASSKHAELVVGPLRQHLARRQADNYPPVASASSLLHYPPAVDHHPPPALVKIYRALVAGLLAHDEGVVDTPIGRLDCPGLLGGVFAASPSGRPAVSAWRVVHRNAADRTTVVDVRIWTGLSHQIRIHMASIGHPLVGDPLFVAGGLRNTDEHARPSDIGYHLHSYQLHVPHPISQHPLHFSAPLPLLLQ